MNYIDFIVILILILSAINGAKKGFIIEVASLIALIVGVWGAIRFSNAAESYLVYRMGVTSSHVNVIAFIIVFLLIIIAIHFLAKVVQKVVEATALSPANRILGAFFAVFKAAFFIGILVLLVDQINKDFSFFPEKDIKHSKFYNPLHNMALSAFPFLQGIYSDMKSEEEKEKKDPSKGTGSI
jgi:membrane protein required for colicin V production